MRNFADRYGPWALILGASEGTGREFAVQLAGRGLPAILVARREAPLAALVEQICDETGVRCVAAAIDLAAPDAHERVVELVAERAVGLLIFNAGSDPNGVLFVDRDLATWRSLVQRNVVTMMACAHHFAGPMQARGRGGILLVNSGACYGGALTLGTYSGSKAFMLCFAEGLWAEMRPHGVDVLTLVLGRTDTPEFRRFMAEKNAPFPADAATPEAVVRAGLDRLPHGPVHNVGQAEDQAGLFSISAADRRKRVELISESTGRLYTRS